MYLALELSLRPNFLFTPKFALTMKLSFFFKRVVFYPICCLIFIVACKTDPNSQKDPASILVDNTVRSGLQGEPDFLSPIISRTGNARSVYRHLFMSMAHIEPMAMEEVPKLAISLPEEKLITEGKYKDGYTYTYEIRPEATWDDGTPITAADYVFTFKIIFNPHVKTGWRSVLGFLKDIQIDPNNPKKFTATSDRCFILAENYLSTAEVYPAHIYDPNGWMKDISIDDFLDASKTDELTANENLKKFAEAFSSPEYTRDPSKVSGAGPYKLENWTTDEQVIIQKKENWWGAKLAKSNPVFTANPDKIQYKIVPDFTSAATMLKAGELDVMAQFPVDIFKDLRDNELGQEKLNFLTPSVPVYYFLVFNTENDRLSDKRVRKALTHLVNLEEYINTSADGYAKRIVGPVHSAKPYYNKNNSLVPFDINAAKTLLDEAGWKDTNSDGVRDKIINGAREELEIGIDLSNRSVAGKAIVEVMKADAQKAGVKININSIDQKKVMKGVAKGDFDIASLGARLSPAQLDDLAVRFHTNSFPPDGGNYSRFGSSATDAILDRINSNCIDEAQRNKDYLAIQQAIYDEQPYIFLFSNTECIAVNKRFDNVKSTPMRPGYFENYFVAKK